MIRLGIIGLGEVAQLMHLPIIHDLDKDYEITAVSDVSPSLVEFIAKKYHVAESYTNPHQLLESENIDAVLILSPDQYHGEHISRALKNGKHVFVEKPVTLCSEELAEVIELKKSYPHLIVMVGFMRRYEGTFLKAKEILEKEPKKTQYLRFRDIILEGPFFIGQTRPIFYPDDISDEVIAESEAKKKAQLDSGIGVTATEEQRTTYQMMTGLGCHSFSAVRELFGVPKKILSVTTAAKGEQVVVVMEFDGFIAIYELINNQQVVQFDASIEIFQGDRKVLIKYETPYIRHQPTTVEVVESTATETKTTIYGPDFKDSFHTELEVFAQCIATGEEPKTTLEDGMEDLKIFEEIVALMGEGCIS